MWFALIGAVLASTAEAAEKIDVAVRRQIAAGRQVGVLVLGQRQLLDGAKAFPRFCEAHKDRPRRELRAEVMKQLKTLAQNEQAKWHEAVPALDKGKKLWLVNGVAATLGAEDIRKVAALDSVRFVFAAGPIPLGGRVGKVAKVLPRQKRQPFSVKGKQVPWNLKAVGADRVWRELKVTGRGVVVAMFDAGVNYQHSDLRNNIWINPGETANNGKDDDGNGLVDDYYGFNFRMMTPAVGARGLQQHGTWTSGIVAGDGSGGTVTGVAPEAQLMVLMAWGGLYAAARAHEYALAMGADVMNMSFSIPNLGEARGVWRLMSEQATAAGLVLVSGAGNFQRLPKPVQLRIPEGIPCVIAAGGVDRNLKVPGFVSLGPVEWASVKMYGDHPMPRGLLKPDVCGFPGAGYPVLGVGGRKYIDPNRSIRGNSFSGPHVAGAAALMLSAAPDLQAWQVKEILEATAKDLGASGKDNNTGAGLLNAFRAVKEAREHGSVTPKAPR